MATTGERIKSARKACGMTQAELAEKIGVKFSAIHKYENGLVVNLKRDTIAALANALDVSPAWLMCMDDNPSSLPANILPLPKMKKVPLVGDIACGTPILAEQNVESFLSMPDGVNADFCLRCKGDSMINARIFNGDIVYIRQQETVEHGEIAAVLIDNEATLKRVYLYDDRIVLEAENPQYRPKSYWGEDMNNVRILGKAVAFTSEVR